MCLPPKTPQVDQGDGAVQDRHAADENLARGGRVDQPHGGQKRGFARPAGTQQSDDLAPCGPPWWHRAWRPPRCGRCHRPWSGRGFRWPELSFIASLIPSTPRWVPRASPSRCPGDSTARKSPARWPRVAASPRSSGPRAGGSTETASARRDRQSRSRPRPGRLPAAGSGRGSTRFGAPINFSSAIECSLSSVKV